MRISLLPLAALGLLSGVNVQAEQPLVRFYNWSDYANPNRDATALLDPKVRDNPGIYPSDAVIEKLFVSTDLPPKIQRVMTREWTRIKTGQ